MVVQPPPQAEAEGLNQGQFLWVLRRQLYGMCEALSAWQDHVVALLSDFGFERGVAGPTLFFNRDTEVVIDLHVDDFHVTGPQLAMDDLSSELDKHLLIKVANFPGIESEYEYLRAGRIRSPSGTLITPDKSYIEKTLDDLSMQGCCSVTTPSIGPIEHSVFLDEDEELLDDPAQASSNRR